MQKIITVIFTVIMLVCLFPMSASAEETLKAPTVQYKLINHDEIALRWTEVEGADGYCIYRTDTETGKTVKYKNTVKGTTVEVKGLKAEIEYIFQVAAVNENNGQPLLAGNQRGLSLQRRRNGITVIRHIQIRIKCGYIIITRKTLAGQSMRKLLLKV